MLQFGRRRWQWRLLRLCLILLHLLQILPSSQRICMTCYRELFLGFLRISAPAYYVISWDGTRSPQPSLLSSMP